MSTREKLSESANYFLVVIGMIAIALLLRELQHIFLPFTIAYFLYFLFAPFNQALQKRKIPLGIIIPLDILIVLILAYFISSFLLDSVIRFSNDIGLYIDKLNYLVRDLAVEIGVDDPEIRNFSIEKMLQNLDYGSIAGGLISSSFNLLGNLLFVLFFFIFIVSGHEGIYQAFKQRYVSGKSILIDRKINIDAEKKKPREHIEITLEKEKRLTEGKLESTFKAIPQQIQKYLVTKIALNAGAGVAVGFAMYIIGVDFPIIWGLFAFFLNFIPSIGSAVALILPVLMSYIQFESFGITLVVAVVMAVLQTAFFNVLEPMILGKRLNLNPLIILISVLIWGYIWGIVGMFLAIPLTAILRIILSNLEGENVKFIADLMDDNDVKKSKIIKMKS